MTLPLGLTLEEVRRKVLLRCGMTNQAQHNANSQAVVDEFIRAAHREYYFKADWQAGRKRLSIAVTQGVATYDWPDETEPGQIHDVYVVNDDDAPFGIDPAPDRWERWWRDKDGRPRFYELVDGGITLYPTPDENYPELIIGYMEREPDLVADSERMLVDSEVVVQLATGFMMEHWQLPGATRRIDEARRLGDKMVAQHAKQERWGFGDYVDPPLHTSRNRWRNTLGYGQRGPHGSPVDQRGYMWGGQW